MLLIGQMIAQIFKLLQERVSVMAKNRSNPKLSKYLEGEGGEHYVPSSGHLIIKTCIV
jgi:hypothetical protein